MSFSVSSHNVKHIASRFQVENQRIMRNTVFWVTLHLWIFRYQSYRNMSKRLLYQSIWWLPPFYFRIICQNNTKMQSIFVTIHFSRVIFSLLYPYINSKKYKMIKKESLSLPDYTVPTFPFEDIKGGKFLNLPKLKTRVKRLNSWSPQESYQYLSFLKIFHKYFASHETTRYIRIFRRMAKLIISRTSSQIKSHHQKIMKRYGSIENAIQYIEFSLIHLLSSQEALFDSVKGLQ